ncbi:MAG: hypothetical protein GY809_24630 [Planctomycetes bacterium]|nr:hypothetical protein [Planctomycetota bacterium]
MMDSMHDRDGHGLPCEEPVTYCIRIRGALNEQWSDCLGGMSISSTRKGDDEFVTTLRGQLADQAALFGVMNTLYDMHLPILQVECLSKDVAD